MTMIVLGYSLESDRRKNVQYLEKQIERNEIADRYREQLFSDFYEKLLEFDIPIVQDQINEFILNNVNTLVLVRDNGKLYLKGDGIVILKYLDESAYNVFECYSVKVINGKLKFIKIQRVFTNYNYDL